MLLLPAAVLAFQDVRTRHELRLEPNIKGVRSALRASLRTPTLVPHHSSSECADYTLSGVEHNLRIGPRRAVSVSQPICQIPRRF
jgi:hypothetical protein